MEKIAQHLYEVMIQALMGRYHLSWDELPPIVQDAWVTVAETAKVDLATPPHLTLEWEPTNHVQL